LRVSKIVQLNDNKVVVYLDSAEKAGTHHECGECQEIHRKEVAGALSQHAFDASKKIELYATPAHR
jgi:hypothetical protein